VINSSLNFLRGVLIGIAEVIPGVSGGTLALITGIYSRLLNNIDLLFKSLRNISDPKIMARNLIALEWKFLLPVFIGMAIALITTASFMEGLLESNPIELRAVFAGLVAAGIYIPYKMSVKVNGDNWALRDYLLALIGALAAFFLTGLPQGEVSNPGPILIFFSAAIAICALVLPGISGSFLLLTIGMYSATIGALNDRDLQYLLIFALGALLGLASFVSLLKFLLSQRARPTLVLLAGLMLGSLRALWPWQGEDRELLFPHSSELIALLLFLAGAIIVAFLVKVEERLGEGL
jgi:Predicted membrane protein